MIFFDFFFFFFWSNGSATNMTLASFTVKVGTIEAMIVFIFLLDSKRNAGAR